MARSADTKNAMTTTPMAVTTTFCMFCSVNVTKSPPVEKNASV